MNIASCRFGELKELRKGWLYASVRHIVKGHRSRLGKRKWIKGMNLSHIKIYREIDGGKEFVGRANNIKEARKAVRKWLE